ncbi:adenosine deaminase [candidate division TA06 bacterium]|nr:adenosine deaminase [candidate division TA06 bacterium]
MKINPSLTKFIRGLPKAELHLHIEGTFEPELMFKIARRNRIGLRYGSVAELRRAYDFGNLQEFLDLYYEGAGVLVKERDFYDLGRAYFKKALSQNVLHAEIFFDPQTHTARGVPFSTVMNGLGRSVEDAKSRLGLSVKLIMCFLRHLEEKEAHKTLEQALDYRHLITAVGLDSSELGHPPSKFKRVFARARRKGFLTVAHAGEEGPAEYVWHALELLKVSRVDHGNRSLSDEKLVKELVRRKMPLTVCPCSNHRLKVVAAMEDHPLQTMMQKGLLVTVNSDDPAYFGGYLNENYLAVASALNLSREEICQLAKNSFLSSFLEEKQKKRMLKLVDDYCSGFLGKDK